MTINSTPLGRALNARWGRNKRGALLALDLDPGLLDEHGNEMRSFDSEPDETTLLRGMHETLSNILKQKAGAHPASDPRGPATRAGSSALRAIGAVPATASTFRQVQLRLRRKLRRMRRTFPPPATTSPPTGKACSGTI
jgi:hypothetical protein